MDTIKNLTTAIIGVTDAGIIARMTYCFLCIQTSPDEESMYIKRMKNMIKYLIIVQCIYVIKTLILNYYGG